MECSGVLHCILRAVYVARVSRYSSAFSEQAHRCLFSDGSLFLSKRKTLAYGTRLRRCRLRNSDKSILEDVQALLQLLVSYVEGHKYA